MPSGPPCCCSCPRGSSLRFGAAAARRGDRRAGISPATLYRRYHSKDDLVAAIALQEARRFLVQLDRSIDIDAPLEEQLVDGMVVLARKFRDQPLLNRIKATEPESVLPRLTTDGARLVEFGTAYLMDRVRRVQASGGFAAFDPEPLAEVITRLVHSLR
jgi:AcrR family transcriptional regulator